MICQAKNRILNAMQAYLITVQGPNQTGMVAEVTGRLYRHAINVMDSAMSTLRGEFVIMLVVSLPEQLSSTQLESLLEPLQEEGMSVSLRALSASEAGQRSCESQPNYSLSVLGQDQTGMIYRFSELLAQHGANLTDVHTQLLDGRHDPPLYAMILELYLPEHRQAHQAELLKVAISQLAASMDLDADLHPLASIEI